MASFVRIARLAALTLAVACGPSVGEDDDTGADTGSTQTTSTSAPESTGAPSCEIYDAVPDIGPRVEITVRHEGTSPVFFRPNGCGGSIVVALRQNGADVPWLVDGECTPNTCDGFVAAADCSVGCNDCAPPQAGRIEAGAMGDSAWPGHVTTELAFEPACAPAADCPATCLRRDQAPAGLYEIVLPVYRTCTGTCTCDGPSPVCGLWAGDEVLSDEALVTAMLDYPAQTTVELVITD